jgi:hypothetical protein
MVQTLSPLRELSSGSNTIGQRFAGLCNGDAMLARDRIYQELVGL